MDWLTTVALATLMIGLFAWLRADGRELRAEISEQGRTLRGEISLLAREIGGLRERMAHMEGLLEGLREAISGKQVA